MSEVFYLFKLLYFGPSFAMVDVYMPYVYLKRSSSPHTGNIDINVYKTLFGHNIDGPHSTTVIIFIELIYIIAAKNIHGAPSNSYYLE